MYCKYCGAKNLKDSQFCKKCGKNIKNEIKAENESTNGRESVIMKNQKSQKINSKEKLSQEEINELEHKALRGINWLRGCFWPITFLLFLSVIGNITNISLGIGNIDLLIPVLITTILMAGFLLILLIKYVNKLPKKNITAENVSYSEGVIRNVFILIIFFIVGGLFAGVIPGLLFILLAVYVYLALQSLKQLKEHKSEIQARQELSKNISKYYKFGKFAIISFLFGVFFTILCLIAFPYNFILGSIFTIIELSSFLVAIVLGIIWLVKRRKDKDWLWWDILFLFIIGLPFELVIIILSVIQALSKG